MDANNFIALSHQTNRINFVCDSIKTRKLVIANANSITINIEKKKIASDDVTHGSRKMPQAINPKIFMSVQLLGAK